MAGDRKLALITGAAGFVGSRIARRFLREGMSVRALDQRPIDVAEAEAYVGDVTDSGVAHRATGGAELVVHCAAVISGAPDETMRVNVEGTRVLLEAAEDMSILDGRDDRKRAELIAERLTRWKSIKNA